MGDIADAPWIQWLDAIQPASAADDLNTLLVLRHLVQVGWIDAATASPLLQLNHAETQGALQRLRAATLGNDPVVLDVVGTPDTAPPALTLSRGARATLQHIDEAAGWKRAWPSRRAVAETYATTRGRISTTELGALVGAQPTNVGPVLRELEEDGIVAPSRPNRRGPGFYYRHVR